MHDVKVKSDNNIEQASTPIFWIRDDPANEKETQAFWKRLRHFYRTSEKPDDENKHLSSALLNLLNDNETRYPFPLGDDQKKTRAIELEEKAPFYILDDLLSKHQIENIKSFKSQLSTLIEGLNQFLKIDDQPSRIEQLKKTFDFADEMIAFDKMVDILPQGSSGKISSKRLIRLKKAVSTMQIGLNQLNNQNGIVVLQKDLKTALKKESIFNKSQILEVKKDAFAYSQELFTDQMQSFTSLIEAFRIGALEIEGVYQEEIHDEYFEHFTWHRLLPDELNLFHPIVLVVDQMYLFEHLTSFSNLMASNQPINVLVLNHELVTTPNHQITWEDASHQFRQELAALAFAHRNVYTFQSGMDSPSALYIGLKNCLQSTFPSICHISVPKDDNRGSNDDIELISKAENAGRYFPRILYDPVKTNEWGGRFDLSDNFQSKETWPKLKLKAQTSNKSEVEMDVAFTYADYKACYQEKAKELMLIPSAHYMEHLIPLNDYLVLDEASLYGKIPYIWLIDENNNLYRAAVPNVWVVSCQERLDFWCFLQELGGINSYHAKTAMKQKEIEMAEIIEETKAQIDNEGQQIIENAQEDAIAKAAERLISVLLDDEDIQLDVEEKVNTSVDKEPNSDSVETQEPKDEKPVEYLKSVQVVNSEPWVDSENCTSCNECTDQYPNLFKYNEEKQAYIDDPTKGTFEELVKAAEKCPAECIHPGMPLNPNEPNVEKLIKRAEKFN